ncbi:MAG: hypothetical protein N3D77_15180, partial [Geminicoccaceae bacterium]|nr:hypothetical protein [Geminicoccaceae bacterium]
MPTTTAATVVVRLVTEPGARVELTTGAYAAERPADPAGAVEFAAVPLQWGANALRARATDAAGNRGSQQ